MIESLYAYNMPYPVIILAFMLQNSFLLQCGKVTFDGALTHRQSLRHFLAGVVGDSLMRLRIFC